MNTLPVEELALGLDILATLKAIAVAGTGVLVVTVAIGIWRLCAECERHNAMKRSAIVLIIAVLSAPSLLGQVGLSTRSAQGHDLFQKALSKERVDGQLTEAIALYERVVNEFALDRPLVAKALLQMARCYERLGNAAAQKTYDRIVREYADQRAITDEARARLSMLTSAPTRGGAMSSRLVWTVPRTAVIYGTVSHDGRYVPYVDWAVLRGNAELFLHDLRSGANRQITTDVKEFGLQYVGDGGTFSPDDAQFAYAFFNKDGFELRIVGLQDPGVLRPRVLFANPEVPRISPDDWSPDGKWLAVQLQRKDKTTQIGLVAVQDGSLRILKSVDWRGASKLFFSPDGKYVAYDLPSANGRPQRDVFALAVDGSRESPIVEHPGNDMVMGWSRDGKHLLFTSDRTGSAGLWQVAVLDGRPQGPPEQIKVDFAGASMGVTSKGTLFSHIHHSSFTTIRSDIHVATLDFHRAEFLSAPAAAVHAFVGANNFPAWSPDGQHLAFLSRRGGRIPTNQSTAIAILSSDTGHLRELTSELNIYVGGARLRWSPDGRALAVQATDSKGRRGIFRIDAATGETTPMVFSTGGDEQERVTAPIWGADGRTLYYIRVNAAGAFAAIVERDLSSAREKEIFRRSLGPSWNPHWMFVELSPDGQYLAAVANEAWPGHNTGKWDVVVIPARGGEPRELSRGQSKGASVLMWAPDSRSLFVSSITDTPAGNREVWRVAIDGSQPQKIGLNVSALGPPFNSDQQFSVHPDGKRVAFAAAEPAKSAEIWALENFRAAAPKGSR